MATQNGGLKHYTVQEAQNSSMGQVGSVYLDTDSTIFTPTNGVVVAITMIGGSGTDFDVLTAEDSSKYINLTTGGYESKGDTISNSDTFPEGLTIFGRWTSVSINTNGSCICYIG